MFSNNLKRSVATLGVVAGLLAVAGPASADRNVTTGIYGLLDETAQPHVTDGTSNTLQFAAARQARGFVDGLKFDTDVVDY